MSIIRNLGINEYHQSNALSKSKLMDFLRYGPRDFKRRWIDRTMPREDSPSMRLGRLFDDLCCDPTARDRWAEPVPGGAPRRPTSAQINAKKPSPETQEAVAWWGDYHARNAGKEMVDEDERYLLLDMLDAFAQNEVATRLCSHCEKQISIRRHLSQYGLEVQSRPDGLDMAVKIIVDIKTCRDLGRFHRDCIDYGYPMQLALGQWMMKQETGEDYLAALIVVENKLAGRCRAYRVPEVALAAGWEKAKDAISEIATRYKTGDWNEPQAMVDELRLEAWQERRCEEAIQ